MIFANTAPLYWASGLQAIPLHRNSKRPVPNNWSQYSETPVPPDQQSEWVASNPHGNIGLSLGRVSGVSMIDIDTDDEKLFKAITEVLPYSPWVRKGKKGVMLAFKFSGLKTFRIKNLNGETLVECLSTGTQCVLPPSIHPDTGQPYVANTELYSVNHTLLPLPENIEEILRNALKACGVELSHAGWSKVTDFVPAGARDTTLTEMAGLFAYAVTRGERTLLEAIGMLRSYHAEFIERTTGDMIDADKHVSNLIKFVERDVLEKGKVLPAGWDAGITKEEHEKLGLRIGKNETEWTYEEIIQYLQEKFESEEKIDPVPIVEEVLLRMAKSPSLSRIDEDRILKYIYSVAKMGVPISTFKARLKELRQGDIKGNDHSEIARAVLEDFEQKTLIRYYGSRFMKWAGSHWVPMETNVLASHISANYGHLAACKKASDIAGVIKVMSYIVEQELSKEKIKGVNFANGFLTQGLKLMPHNPDYGCEYTLPFRYLEEKAGNFPMFTRFLNGSWGKDGDYWEKVNALQEALCVTLFGFGSKFQKAILLHGAPKSGKSQLLTIVQCLVPKEGKCAVPPNDWHDKFLPAMMSGKILNICGELSERKKIEGQIFKDVIDGSERSAQFKNQQIFTMKPELTHWFASNHLPKSDDTSRGFIRRWLMLTFNHPVDDRDIELDLGQKIAAEEREAIVAWAVQAMPRLMENQHYTLPHSHRMLEIEFANINNSVRMFLIQSGKCKFGIPDEETSEHKAFNAYWAWVSSMGGQQPVKLPKFRAMMRELQSELDIELKIVETATGGTDCRIKRMVVVN